MGNIIRFNDSELEMAMITYERPSFVKDWLSNCLMDIIKFNIKLSIFDSSISNDTFDVIKEFNEKTNNVIIYKRLPSTTTGGYKYVPPILETTSKYIMIVGDSRCHSVSDLCERIHSFIRDNIELIVLSFFNNESYEIKKYQGLNPFLEECFIPITCCGMTVFRTSVFDSIRLNSEERERFDNCYKDKFGFAYLGYYLESFAYSKQSSVFVKSPWKDLNPQKKIQHWNKKFYECWCDELCQIMDYLPNQYENKDYVLRSTWSKLHIDSFETIMKAKRAGGLRFSDYRRMKEKGYLSRVTDKRIQFFFSSFLPKAILSLVYFFYTYVARVIKRLKRNNSNKGEVK